MKEYKVFKLQCPRDLKDIFIAELADIGFDAMQETDEGIEAYSENDISEKETKALLKKYDLPVVEGHWEKVANTNWNEEWEKNYDPVEIDDRCIIKAGFHKIEKSYPLEIIINPRMSFGTGHHATTYLMAKAGLNHHLEGMDVLDAGCGTGVLAILAEKRKAKRVMAYDVSQLCVENTEDNIRLNDCQRITVQTGTIRDIEHPFKYDVIFANINRNALIDEMEEYAKHLKKGGNLFLSGFFQYDADELIWAAENNGLSRGPTSTRNDWACMRYTKP